ncbi:GrpB family protein [Spartinivicinus ruber]|uniref:GrpB family protein n=1 Tax=Spartinivicinus ruber TaxID=2683272 RepID=UPI0013D219D4|nr:GrpB family protein [Spartinivicinus ruber]
MKLLNSDQYYERNKLIFDQVTSKIIHAIPFARVEHIGSSAIKGAISKGDLDIFVGVPLAVHQECIDKIISLGFRIKKDTLRTESLCMLEAGQYECDTAIQLVANGSKFEFFLVFRDKLKSDYRLLLEYNNIKLSCQNLSEEQYREKKATLLDRFWSFNNSD